MMFLNPGVLVVVGVAVVMLLALWQGDRALQRSVGAAKEVAKIEKRSLANAQKADAARRSVDAIPADELRDKYARD
jgi:cytochrome oxidase assembly protein ShyY1